MPDDHQMMTPADAHVDRPNPVGPDGLTRLAGDAAYDRLHGVDGHIQSATSGRPRFGNPAGVPDAYAAFVGAEAELARLRSALERILDYWDGRPLLAYHGHHIFAELMKALGNEESDQ